jgi:DNA-binding response OmpR family regulator
VLHLFLRRSGCIFALNEILNTVGGCSHFITSHDIDCIVAKLRNRIESDPSAPTFIHTVEGIGYKFEPLNSHGNCSNN